MAWARSRGGLLIEDDYDAELRYDRQPVGALQALAPDRIAYAGTISKTLAPGLRLGWLALPPSLVEPLVRLRRVGDVHVPAPDQLAFAELLASGAFERHVRRMRARYRSRRDRVLEVLARHAPAVTPVGISAGLRLLLELPPGGPTGEELAREARARSIELVHVAGYRHGGGRHNGVLIGYAAPPEQEFEPALAALGDLLASSYASARSRASP